jgi:hypothetical protein
MTDAPDTAAPDLEATPPNPQAFPSTGEGLRNPHYSEPGMTLRDHFAGVALSVAANTPDDPMMTDDQTVRAIARLSYALADAMLRERAK